MVLVGTVLLALVTHTAGTDAGKQQKRITWHYSTASYTNIYIYLILTANYLHKATAKMLKECVQTCQSVFYSLPCVCDVGCCWVLILTDCGQWARALLKPYLNERRISPNPAESVSTPSVKPRDRGSGSCVCVGCESSQLSRCFSVCFLQYSAVKMAEERSDEQLEAQWEFDLLPHFQLNRVRALFCPCV